MGDEGMASTELQSSENTPLSTAGQDQTGGTFGEDHGGDAKGVDDNGTCCPCKIGRDLSWTWTEGHIFCIMWSFGLCYKETPWEEILHWCIVWYNPFYWLCWQVVPCHLRSGRQSAGKREVG